MPCRRQNAVSAGYDNCAPPPTNSSWTRTRFPLHWSKSSRICCRWGSAFSVRCNSGTAVEFERRTRRTVTREIPITRAISRFATPCVCNSRIVVRCAWLNMRCLLRKKFFTDALELFLNSLDLLARRGTLLVIQLHCLRTGEPSMGAIDNRGYHFQIANQFSG